MEKDEFHALLRAGESTTLDFKQTITAQKIARTLVAFANTEGGTILIGIADNKHIIGVDTSEEMFVIEQAAKKYCQPPINYDYDIFEDNYKDEKTVLIVNVSQSSSKDHKALDNTGKWHTYLRMGDKNILIAQKS